ncbi:MAG: prepilin-type N-terminal cleavage/methylation domain-containing protein [Candidatus Paceibacterota bacterium]|jgi:prepilin-type N-terminal cleavage/methylation domain-containing protein
MSNSVSSKQQALSRNSNPASCLLPPAHYGGFTLVETMVAIAILTLAISGSFFAANSSMVAAGVARDQLIASYLAQEGIEYARLLRDNAYLAAYNGGDASGAWDDFLASVALCQAPKICTLDPLAGELTGCTGDVCTEPLYLSDMDIYTQQQIDTITPFIRTIQVTGMSTTDEKIVSEVSWSYHSRPHSVTITDNLKPLQ